VACYDAPMTTVELFFRYATQPADAQLLALNSVREVYGIRAISLNQSDKTIKIEYDATRLNQATVTRLLLQSGFAVVEEKTCLVSSGT